MSRFAPNWFMMYGICDEGISCVMNVKTSAAIHPHISMSPAGEQRLFIAHIV
jgi:hypothetical protein